MSTTAPAKRRPARKSAATRTFDLGQLGEDEREPGAQPMQKLGAPAPPAPRRANGPAVAEYGGDLPDPTVEEDLERWEGWDGQFTAIAVAHPVIRDHNMVGANEPCVGWTDPETRVLHPCTLGPGGKPARTHQFHIRASFTDGRWRGPESDHIQDLIQAGFIPRTQGWLDREGRQALIDMQRGVHLPPGNPDAHPEFKAITATQARAQHRLALAGGPAEVIRKEHQEARSEVSDLVRAANILRGAMGQAPITEADLASQMAASRTQGL